MNQGKYVFSQIVTFLPTRIFDRCVNSFQGDKWVKHFTCWNQMMCMMFGQLSNRDSLRDLLVCLTAHKTKHYHLGFGKNISKSNLAESKEKRDCQIFEMYAYELIAEAQKICVSNVDFDKSITGNVYAFDSTTIDLCLNVFWWATFRRAKGAVKLHTLLDVRTAIPVFMHITPASVHDVNGLDFITYEPGGYYIMDRGYIDFDRMATIDKHDSFFVIRSKTNLSFVRVSAEKPDKAKGVLCDQRIKLKGFNSIEKYEKVFRRVKFYDAEQKRSFVFLSNNLTLPATEIALLYKNRWKIELFFKWIKQHLKIKSFWGVSENAVRTQIYIAIITYTLVAIIKAKLKLKQSPYEILQIMSVSLLDKTRLPSLFENPIYQDVKDQNHIQLRINLILPDTSDFKKQIKNKHMTRVDSLSVKIFADGADKVGMLDMYQKPYIKGLTTNPTLMKKAGITNYESFAKDILTIVNDKPISFEVFSDDLAEMEKQALKISTWGKNVYVKIPITNTKKEYTYSLVKKLADKGVKINVTAIMTLDQVRDVVLSLNQDVESYVSVFAGRIADTGVDPLPLMAAAVQITSLNAKAEVIWASPRELLNIFHADSIGCQVITVTNDILKKLELVEYDLNEYSLDTVKMFYNDAMNVGFTL